MKDVRVPGCPSSKNIRCQAYKDSFQTVFYEAIGVSVSIVKNACTHPDTFFFFSDQAILEENIFRQDIPQVRTQTFEKGCAK